MSALSPNGNGVNQRKIEASHYLWIVLPLICGIQVADALTGQGVPVLYPYIRDDFGLSRAQIGFITSAYSMGGLLSSVLAGWLTDKMGVKRISVISLASMAVFTIAILMTYSWTIILILMLLVGVATSPGYPASTRAIMDWVPARFRALAMSVKQMGVPLGGALMAAMLPILTVVIGWRMAGASMGVLVLIFAIVFMLLYRDPPQSAEVIHKLDTSTKQAVFRNRGLVVPIVWATTITGFHFIVLTYFMLFLIETLQLSPIIAGGALAIIQVSSGIGRVMWGAASDFVFHGRRIMVLAITGFLTAMWLWGISLMSAGVPNVAVYVLAVLIGISTLSYQGVFTTLIGETAGPGRIGVTAGVANTVIRIGMLVMPPLFGYLVDMNNSYYLGWRIGAAVALVITLALLIFGRETHHR